MSDVPRATDVLEKLRTWQQVALGEFDIASAAFGEIEKLRAEVARLSPGAPPPPPPPPTHDQLVSATRDEHWRSAMRDAFLLASFASRGESDAAQLSLHYALVEKVSEAHRLWKEWSGEDDDGYLHGERAESRTLGASFRERQS